MSTIKHKIIANYWKDKLKDYGLFEQESHVFFSSVSNSINNDKLGYFLKVTSGNEIAEFTILLSVFGALSQRYFEDCQLIFSKKIIENESTPLLYALDSIKDKTLRQYIQRVKEEVQEVYKHMDYADSPIKGGGFANYAPYAFSYNNEIEGNSIPFHLVVRKFRNAGYKISISFSSNFVKKHVVVHFLESFKNWIVNLEDYLTEFVDGISILAAGEEELLLNVFNDTKIDFDSSQTIISLFTKQVIAIPDDIAIIFGDKKMSYRSLDEQSNQLAHYLLKKHQLCPEDLVAVKLERSEWLVISLLAILKLGSTYVPIDINYPQDRISYIENDSNSKVVIDELLLGEFKGVQDDFSKEKIDVNYEADTLAYIIYTSGTTGNPKGVMITHGNAVGLIQWSQKEFDSSIFSTVYAATSHCFDLSIFEMFYTLSVGKTIRVLSSGLDIPSYLSLDKSILLNTVPSTIRKILEEGHNLSNVAVLNLAGEPFPLDIANKFTKTTIDVRNLYGPSEDTTYSTYYKLTNDVYKGSVPIGKPISNTRAYILDDSFGLLPVGVTGKLYLSGTGLTAGYLNRPDLTSGKFINNPYEEGAKMYDTGDLARWQTDGNIMYLGRKDNQIKLRGYRIELGEIENTISQFSEDIQQVVVVIKKLQKEETLVAYYVENNIVDKSQLRLYLVGNLPSYMIPNHFVILDSIPLTPNGKVDKKALPEVASSDVIRDAYLAPGNDTEERLIFIWEEILGIKDIGVRDNFFELGGHSLMISQMFNRVHKRMNKSISFKAFYSNPTVTGVSKLLQKDVFKAIRKAPRSDSYPVTPSQHRLWLLSQIEKSNQAYRITGAVSLEGNIVVENFTKSFNHVVNRHEILRTYFKNNEEGVLRQYLIPESDFDYRLSIEDFSQSDMPYESVERYVQECQNKGYDLSMGPLFMASLIRVSNNKFIFFLSMHHIISDGWSLEVLTSEIIKCYRQLPTEEAPSLHDLSIQFKDYAVWLKETSKKREHKQAKEYWLNVFKGNLPVLELPSFTNRPLIKTYSGDTLNYSYSKEVLLRLKDFSQHHQVTLFMTLMTTLKILLSRYSNQRDIIVGTATAGREHPDLESQVGLYLNTLAIRTHLGKQDSFLKLLEKVRQQLLDAYAHQEYPFDQLVGQLDLKRDTSRSPLFDVMAILQNQQQLSGFRNEKELTDVTIDEFKINRKTSQFDLSFTFIEKEEGLSLELCYNTDIYEDSFVAGIFSHLENIFNQILVLPDIEIEAIDFLTVNEKQILLEDLNDTQVGFNVDQTIIDLFKEQVSKTPESMAIVFGDNCINYRSLDDKSSQLAHYLLQNYGVNPEDLIAVKLERSEWLIISLLAILKSGGAYVPIDKEYPETRIQYIIEDADTKIVIDEKFLSKFFNENQFPTRSPEVKVSPDHLAYVIYTSGSTGKPKGVMIEHKSLLNLCLWHKDAYGVNGSSRGTLFSGVAFDASVWEIYPYLLSGATLYPINDNEIRLNTNKLVSFLKDQRITHTYLPSKICQNLIEQGIRNLNTIILTGGEALKYSKKTTLQIYNNYGPTENTVVTSYYNCKDIFKENIPIGKPIDNTEVYILSENLVLQPIGVIGELCISGIGLSRGYFGRPKLTQEKFIEHPFEEGRRLYKTGDIARWLPDGNLEFVGRKDQQIKIRGNRIELGEIEYAIIEYSEFINQAVVVLNEINQEKVLVAHYVASGLIDNGKLREFLTSHLPYYMVPGYFSKIETIPLTANGKINRKKLPKITKSDIIRKKYVAPTNETEEKIVHIWKEILELSTVGITDDFFELGGHSLLLNKLTNEYHRIFNKDMDLKEIYANTTPKDHAKFLKEKIASGFHEIEKIAEQQYYESSPSQIRFWLLYRIHGKSKEFNIYSKLPLPIDLDVEIFESTFNELLKRHEILRTVFIEENGTPKQKILSYEPIEIAYHETNEAMAVQSTVYNHKFDLGIFPLFKVALVKEHNDFMLFFNMHHIICDGWSIGIIYQELMEIYRSRLSETTPNIPSVNIHYKDYSQWINNLLSNDAGMDSQLNYWKEKLSGKIPYLQLPADYTNKLKSTETKSAYYKVFLENESKLKIEALSASYKCSVFSVFVATLKMLLNRLTSEEDIVIGIPAANRNHYQLKNMVGCFLNTLMLRDTLDVNASFHNFLLDVNKTLINGLAHQNYPFEYVLEQLNIPKDQSRFPLSSVFLNMLDFDAKSTEVIHDFNFQYGNLEASPKFDFECYLKSYTNGYEVNCVYNSELFKKETIKYWIDEYMSIVKQVVETPLVLINGFNIFDEYIVEVEDPKPLNEFDFFETEEINQSIIDRFEKQVSKFPDRIAIACDYKFITYQELNKRANYLGHKIVRETSNEHHRITLLLHHEESSIIGMLGVLKTGHSYVPIDPLSPLNRIQFIIQDSGSDIIICSDETFEKTMLLKQHMPNLKILVLSSNEIVPETSNLEINIDPQNEAYILYTSGSTGTPKGVIQNHRNILHFIRVYTNNIHISKDDTLSVFSTYTFDASVKDIYGAILNGAIVGIYDITKNGLNNLANWLRFQNVTIIHMVPTIYRYFLKELEENEVLETVRIVDLGGEACYKSDFDGFKKYFSKKALLVNDYGPTESTIVSQKFLSHDSLITRNSIPLGKAVEETEIYVLDENNNRKGIYQEGEIVFKSDYLSLGYLNCNELTERAFIPDPIRLDGSIVYKSGDIGRVLPTGEIEFIKRKDGQVKLNGQRIELADIEQNLLKIPEIEEAIVLLKNIGEDKLVAYIKTNEKIDRDAIISHLGHHVPAHMIPLLYVFMDDFPLTRTGKINKRDLPIPSVKEFKKEFLAPSNETELLLVEIIADSLDIDEEKISLNDSFFDLGGNSLKMIKVLNLINEKLNVELKLLTLFKYPTIRLLVEEIYGEKVQKELIEDNMSESIDDMIDLISE